MKIWSISPDRVFMPSSEEAPKGPPLADLRMKNVQQNPGAAALNFELVMKVFMEEVLAWDFKNKTSKKPGGLFGPTTAWAYAGNDLTFTIIRRHKHTHKHRHDHKHIRKYTHTRKELRSIIVFSVCILCAFS